MLVTTRHIGESIIINGNVEITVLGIRGSRVKLGTIAPREVIIARQERKHLRFTEADMRELSALNETFSRRHSDLLESPTTQDYDPCAPIKVLHTPRTQQNLAQMLGDEQVPIYLKGPACPTPGAFELDTQEGVLLVHEASESADHVDDTCVDE